MQYLISGIETHPDRGFGITADAYYESALHLMGNPFPNAAVTQQAEMPQNFLFRHAIELYLKSLIMIFHKELQIPYGYAPYDTDEPEVLIDGQWRKLYNSHFIDKLYEYWLTQLLKPNSGRLKQGAPKGDWSEPEGMPDLFALISKYDKDSAYFRYPITKNSSLDPEKYSVQKIPGKTEEDVAMGLEKMSQAEGGSISLLQFDKHDNFVNAFRKEESILTDVRHALQTVAETLSSIHAMTRSTLCSGT